MSDRRFPVITDQSKVPREIRATWPQSVPWTYAERFRKRAHQNHDQSLEELARRGGLAPYEIWCALHDRPLFTRQGETHPGEQACGEWLIAEMQKLGEGPS